MEKRNVKLSLEDAKKLYNQGGNFRTIALSAYSKDELVFNPKDGDFVYVQLKNRETYLFIKDSNKGLTSKYISLNLCDKDLSTECPKCCDDNEIIFIRLAIRYEEQLFLNVMHKEGKDWDPINKKIISYRWRAKEEEYYYYVDSTATVLADFEYDSAIDIKRYEKHNYFKTKEEAQKVAYKINNIFKEL